MLKKIFFLPFLLLFYLYKYVFSFFLPKSCRFEPSCSNYAIIAFKRFGVIKGSILTIIRLLRCNPWGGYGIDDVPKNFNYKDIRKFLTNNKLKHEK